MQGTGSLNFCEPSGTRGSYGDLCEPGSPGKLDHIYCCFWFIVLIRGNERGEQVWQGKKDVGWSWARYSRKRGGSFISPSCACGKRTPLECCWKPRQVFLPVYPEIQLDSPLNLLSSFCQSMGKIGRTRPLKAQPFAPWKCRASRRLHAFSPALSCYSSVKSIFHLYSGCTN